MSHQRLGLIKAALRRWARGRGRADSGAVSPIFALMLVPLLGGLGMATEAGNWYLAQRAMQNAADSAAIAAATNNSGVTNPSPPCATAGDYCFEGQAAATQMGYTNGSNISVAVNYLTAGCPGIVTNCYMVTITQNVPLSLLKVVGYTGTGGGGTQKIQVVSIARAPGVGTQFCDIALGGSFTIHGGPKVKFNGCSIFSDGSATCDGSNSDAGIVFGEAVDSSSCGTTQLGHQPSISDPFSSLSSNIPPFPGGCPSTPKNPTIISGMPASGLLQVCGNAEISSGGFTPINMAGSQIIIYNGGLLLNGQTLSTTGSGSATLIFSGTNASGNTASEFPTGSGTIDIAAPNSGTFSGVAIMQDSGLTDTSGRLDMSYSGSSPTLDIQGLIYMPNGNFQISGAINMHSKGLSCIGVIAQTILVNGNGSIFDNDALGPAAQCPQAGLTLPTVPGTGARQALVQ